MITAQSFRKYCDSKAIRYAMTDSSEDGSYQIRMLFSDQEKKRSDVGLRIEFNPNGPIDLLFSEFAHYEGQRDRQTILQRLNAINAASPFANFILLEDEIMQLYSFAPTGMTDSGLMDLIYFLTRLCSDLSNFIFKEGKV